MNMRRQRYAAKEHIRRSKKNSNLKNKYGITMDEFDRILEDQGYGCGICGTLIVGAVMRAHIDHCHETKIVRGILCNNCNNGLGRFKDNPDLLRSAIIYLSYSGSDSGLHSERDYS